MAKSTFREMRPKTPQTKYITQGRDGPQGLKRIFIVDELVNKYLHSHLWAAHLATVLRMET